MFENNAGAPKIVLIIGESTQRASMSLYGYGLPTTPRIDALAKTGNLAVFTDTIAPQTYTEGVLQQLLTFSNAQNAATPWFEQENLLDLMKLFWLQNALQPRKPSPLQQCRQHA